jgi:hypothetical protein
VLILQPGLHAKWFGYRMVAGTMANAKRFTFFPLAHFNYMPTSLIDDLEWREVPSIVPASESDLEQRLKALRFNLACPPPKLEPRYFINGIGICTAGNLTTVASAIKSGKSAFVGAMMATVIAPDSKVIDCLGVTSSNPEGLGLIHFDTEQASRDHHDLIVRTLYRAGLPEPPPWVYSYRLAELTCFQIRQCLPLACALAREECGGVHSVLIDGVADMVADVNDPREANALVNDLHRLAIEYGCPILGVIHLNPGQEDKTRGHLGSQLERKAETNLRLTKNKDVTTVWSEKNRRAPIFKEQGPRFCWSDEYAMHVSVKSPPPDQEPDKKQRLRALAKEVLKASPDAGMTWRGMVDGIMHQEGIGESGARKKLDAMLDQGVIRKTVRGEYELV